MTPAKLATAVVQYIQRNPDCSYERIKARARELVIPQHTFMAAMAMVHKRRDIRTDKNLCYRYEEPAPRKTIDWRLPTELYPIQDDTNNADHPIFADLDLSFLFMTVEERQAFFLKEHSI
jgi:hypothetical protein